MQPPRLSDPFPFQPALPALCTRLCRGLHHAGLMIGIGALLASAVSLPHPASAAEKSAKPRSEVDQVPGDYIQLETLWVPVRNKHGGTNFLGLVVRLWPGDKTRYEACIDAPKMTDALLVTYNKTPMPIDTYMDDEAMLQSISDVIESHTEKGVFKKVEAFKDFVIPDNDSAALSLTCR